MTSPKGFGVCERRRLAPRETAAPARRERLYGLDAAPARAVCYEFRREDPPLGPCRAPPDRPIPLVVRILATVFVAALVLVPAARPAELRPEASFEASLVKQINAVRQARGLRRTLRPPLRGWESRA